MKYRNLPLRAFLAVLLALIGTAALGTFEVHKEVLNGSVPPSLFSLLPPMLALALAVATGRVVPALMAGALAACFVMQVHPETLSVNEQGFFADTKSKPETLNAAHYLTHEIKSVFTSTFKHQIVLFVFFLLAMVGVFVKAGAMQDLLSKFTPFTQSKRRVQATSFGMGLLIFFDDYSNSVMVGSVMRPLADKVKLCREKLAYIIDSTAAPVAGLSIFSTWVAYEISLFEAPLKELGYTKGGYQLFIDTLSYRYYCWLTLFFVALVAFTGRDFGPMKKAMTTGGTTGKTLKTDTLPSHINPNLWVALCPLVLTLGWFFWQMILEGEQKSGKDPWTSIENLKTCFTKSENSAQFLMQGSGLGLLLAMGMGRLFSNLSFRENLQAIWGSTQKAFAALGILISAWILAGLCEKVGTNLYINTLLDPQMNRILLAPALFIISALVALGTGTSWGTMTLLVPLAVKLTYDPNLPNAELILMATIGAVLEGSIFGDHCSPISDTTVLSSMASGADHMAHVKTQMPYALLTMGAAMGFGYLPIAMGWYADHPKLGLVLGALFLIAVLRIFGKKTTAH